MTDPTLLLPPQQQQPRSVAINLTAAASCSPALRPLPHLFLRSAVPNPLEP